MPMAASSAARLPNATDSIMISRSVSRDSFSCVFRVFRSSTGSCGSSRFTAARRAEASCAGSPSVRT